MARIPLHLPSGTVIHHYRLEQVLGGGGFSVVYLATNLTNNQKAVVKEYFPAKLARREENHHVVAKDAKSEKLFNLGRKLFFQEASLLASLHHPNIVRILSFFRGYSTVYTAMHYEKGISLQAYLKKKGGHRSENFITAVFKPFLECVKAVHEQGLLHLDIKPGNIYLLPDATPLLLDFGAAHKVAMSSDSRLFPVVSNGFSPIEQSYKNAKLGPWTDIYAIGATMRACMDGKPPTSAKKRKHDDTLPPASFVFEGEYSSRMLEAIDWAMGLHPHERPQTVQELIDALW